MQAILLPSEIRDVNGNWVRYEYLNDGSPTRIHSNDGRDINIFYDGPAIPKNSFQNSLDTVIDTPDHYIGHITSHGRRWDYQYSTSSNGRIYLSRVDLPDGRHWSLDLWKMDFEPNPCWDGTSAASPFTVFLTHPNGVVGTFTISETHHADEDSALGGKCSSFNGEQGRSTNFYKAMSVTQKVLSGSDYLPATWQYSYQGHVVGTPLPPEKWSQSIDPLGRKVVEYFATGGANVGQMLRSEVYESIGASAFSQKTEYVYQNEASLGESWLDLSNPARYEFPRHQKEITTTIDGDTYRTVMTYNSAQGTQGYSFGSPTLTERFAVPSGTTRTQSVAYSHNTNNWIIGLPDKITRNGKLFDDFDFDAKGRLTEYRQFGVRQATVTYHETGNQAGQIHTYKDALNRTTTLTNYKRGQAQNIAMPEGVSVSRVVDDNGWVTSVTNGRGYSTSYDYTDMGWIERIDRHHPWADSVFSYGSIGSGLTQTETRGTSRITLTHDGLLRPIRTKTEDLTGRSNAVYKSMAYDALSRETFSSFPSFSANPATGLDTTYDVLNRATRVRENVAPFATTTTAYLSGARMRVTDPVGAQTTTTYRRFGSPDEGEVIKIQQPEGVTTEMAYDIFGNMLTARQYGSSNGYSVDQTQRYYYDDRLRLCRHSVPETKSTVYSYDDANQMVWRATGRSETANCPALANSNARIFYSYDDLGRVTGVNYPGATPDISHQYDANGNVTRTSNGAATWNYIYTSADQLHRETLTVDGRTYGLVHGYNPTGHRTSLTFPNGKKATFFPDGMGRPTRVQDGFGAGRDRWADNIDYHPNGAVYGINYLNGHTLTQTQNARQLLETIDVGNGPSVAVSLIYDHDANGRVTSIFDSVNPGWNRSFGYDDLGRLETASGPWGTGDYDYDALGNMRRKQLGASVVELDYGTTNRLSRVRESSNGGASFAGWRNYAYDNRGNVTNNGKIAYQYRWTDQPHRMSGSGAAGDFLYDGNLKRVKQVQGGKTIYSVYSQSGAMLYRDNITDNETTAYIPGSGGIRLKNGVPDYTHKDHLGSPVAMTDASGTVLWRELYSPYGLKQIDPAANRDNEGFTGHIDDAASGLTYMQARYYDPNIGRFLSNDPVGFAQGGPGYFNRYAYTLNNPANATDPDGEFAIQIGGGLLGAGLGAVVGAATAAFNGGDIKTGALKGAISGGVIGATGNVALGAAAAAIVGGVDGARAASSKEGATTKSIALGAVSGAIIDGVSTAAGGAVGKVIGGAAGGIANGVTTAITAVATQTIANNTPALVDATTTAVDNAVGAVSNAIGQTGEEVVNPNNYRPDPCTIECGSER